jgi:hypothetical protein
LSFAQVAAQAGLRLPASSAVLPVAAWAERAVSSDIEAVLPNEPLNLSPGPRRDRFD